MVKKIMHDPLFLAQKSVDATDPLFPVRWKSYIDKVGSYQGEIVSKSEVLKKFESKVKRSQSRIIAEEWEECNLLLRQIFEAFVNQ